MCTCNYVVAGYSSSGQYHDSPLFKVQTPGVKHVAVINDSFDEADDEEPDEVVSESLTVSHHLLT